LGSNGARNGVGSSVDGDHTGISEGKNDNSGDKSAGPPTQDGSNASGGLERGSLDSGVLGSLTGNGGPGGTEFTEYDSGGGDDAAGTLSSFPTYSVPEPGSLFSFFAGLGLIGGSCVRRKKFGLSRTKIVLVTEAHDASSGRNEIFPT
jgi:hypothetical protein